MRRDEGSQASNSGTRPRYEIGDIVPLSPGEKVNRRALGYIKARQTRAANAAKVDTGAAKNQVQAQARLIAQGNADAVYRQADPFEQAKSFLQQRGYVVVAASVYKAGRKGIVVGRQTLPDRKAVMAYAQSLGFVVRDPK